MILSLEDSKPNFKKKIFMIINILCFCSYNLEINAKLVYLCLYTQITFIPHCYGNPKQSQGIKCSFNNNCISANPPKEIWVGLHLSMSPVVKNRHEMWPDGCQ